MRAFGVAILILSGSGCASELVPTSGTVTLDGKPVEGATVTLLPDDPQGSPAFGFTDAAGRFKAHTANDGGMRPGKYVGVVIKDEPAQPATGPVPAGGTKTIDALSSEELAEGMRYNARTPRKSVIPLRYAERSTSRLIVEVGTGRSDFDLALTSKP